MFCMEVDVILLLYELQTLLTSCIYFYYVPKATTNAVPSKQ